MDRTIRTWTRLSRTLCLCQTSDHDIDLLLAAPDHLRVYSPNQHELLLVGNLQTTYQRAFRSPPIPTCERLLHFLMDPSWCDRLTRASLPRLLSDDQFVQYACIKLMAHVFLALNPSLGNDFLPELWAPEARLASLTLFRVILDAGHDSNHPLGTPEDPGPCNRCVSMPGNARDMRMELLQLLETRGVVKDAVTMETEMLYAGLRLWDSALEWHKRANLDFDWDLDVVETVFKMDDVFVRWPSAAILRFFAIANKYAFDGRCSRIRSLATALIDFHIKGGLDAIAQFAPARTLGGCAPLGGAECPNPAFRLSALLVLKCVVVATESERADDAKRVLSKLVRSIKDANADWVWRVFSEEDDCLAEALDATLDIYVRWGECEWGSLEPNGVFYAVVSGLGFDYRVLLDWIISNETPFLRYFVKYLKYLIGGRREGGLVEYSSSSGEEEDGGGGGLVWGKVDAILELCRNLNRSICRLEKRGIFPFNVKPLVRLLSRV